MNYLNVHLAILAAFAISFSVLASSYLQQVNGQTTTTTNLIAYQNPTLGFSLQHPSNWQVDEGSASDGIIRFTAPDKSLPIFVVSVKDSAPYLDTDTLTLKNTTLQQSVQEKLDFYSLLSQRTGLDYRVTRQSEVTVGGNAGIKVEYILGNHYTYEVFSNVNGKLYTLEYKDTPLSVPQTVPLANKVVESFQFLT